MQRRWLLRVAALSLFLLAMVVLLQEFASRGKLPGMDKWTPIGANIGTILVSFSVIFGGIVSFQKYIGTRFLQPTTTLELELTLTPMGEYSLVAVNVRIKNRGVRTIVVRGDGTRDTGSIVSTVGVVPQSDKSAANGQLIWRTEDQVDFLLDEQARGLWIDGVPPSEEPREFRQVLAPAQETELPFLFAVSRDTVAALVRAQIYVEDKHGRDGGYVHADKVVQTTDADQLGRIRNDSTATNGDATSPRTGQSSSSSSAPTPAETAGD
jgi:hypothetical protein